MRSLSLPILLALCCCSCARHHSTPEDLYAFPKYRVTFLNGLPLLNDTAQQWIREGLFGGELQFLEEPWEEDHTDNSPKSISSGDDEFSQTGSSSSKAPDSSGYKLEQMKLGPQKSYLCLIPPARDSPATVPEDLQADVTPVHSWNLLQPLAGSCLYHRQGWFTYSYCHNDHVRQFREMSQSQPNSPHGQVPEEDPEWEAYTLGRSPTMPEQGAELTVAQQAALENNLQLARGAGSRYLVQRWSDGTICDKTGQRRGIEIQFHCSMTTTDTILFVKETKTCHYIMVIHTPRLCGEPGFKTRIEQGEEASIRCRQIVDGNALIDKSLPESPHAHAVSRKQHEPIVKVSPNPAQDAAGEDAASKQPPVQTDLVRRALAALFGGGGVDVPFEVVTQENGGDGIIFEFLVDEEGNVHPPESSSEGGEIDFDLDMSMDMSEPERKTMIDALRAAGYDIKHQKRKSQSDSDAEGEEDPAIINIRDEL